MGEKYVRSTLVSRRQARAAWLFGEEENEREREKSKHFAQFSRRVSLHTKACGTRRMLLFFLTLSAPSIYVLSTLYESFLIRFSFPFAVLGSKSSL
jgi:hypothetical protein